MKIAVSHQARTETIVSTTPFTVVSYVVSFVAAVLVPGMALSRTADTSGDTTLIVAVVCTMMLAGFVWSAWKYRRLETTGDGIVLVRGLPPLRRRIEIPFSVIRRSYITDYSHQLVLELEDGCEVVVANYYSVPRSALPEVELAPHELGGVYKTLKRLKALIDARLENHPSARSGSPGDLG
jgi:hypothetical protein